MAENYAQTLREVEYTNNVTHELRQEPGVLMGLAGSTANYFGKKSARIESRFGRMQLQDKTTRNGDTNNTDPNADNRFIRKPGSANIAPLIDRDDVAATSVGLKSPIVMETTLAVRAYHDDMMLRGWWGPSYGGETGELTIAFPAGNKVPVNFGGAATGLTKAKLIELRRVMGNANVSMQLHRPIILVDPDAQSDLLNIPEYVNMDYAKTGGAPLETGELKPWLGFRFFDVNLADAEAFPRSAPFFRQAGVNRLPVFIPSGIHRGVWTEFFGRITERDDKQFSEQVYSEAESTAVRTDDKKTWFVETKPAGA
jgi:hypothetical protein